MCAKTSPSTAVLSVRLRPASKRRRRLRPALGVGTGFGPAAYGPHWPRLPPPASLAPIGLACPHGDEEGPAVMPGIGLRM
jgi:hypothetical protein